MILTTTQMIEGDYRHLKSLSKAEVIARYPSRLDMSHLKSEPKAWIIDAILRARYGEKAVEVWANQ